MLLRNVDELTGPAVNSFQGVKQSVSMCLNVIL
jgi:hypothetical protein